MVPIVSRELMLLKELLGAENVKSIGVVEGVVGAENVERIGVEGVVRTEAVERDDGGEIMLASPHIHFDMGRYTGVGFGDSHASFEYTPGVSKTPGVGAFMTGCCCQREKCNEKYDTILAEVVLGREEIKKCQKKYETMSEKINTFMELQRPKKTMRPDR